MRPFKIPLTNRWVDLDTIQSINEPYLLDTWGRGGYFIRLAWQHAFRDDIDVRDFPQPSERSETTYFRVSVDAEGNPSELSKIHSEVFVPFFNAWRSE